MHWACTDAAEERMMKLQVLTFIEEFCRGLTLRDVRELYRETFETDCGEPGYVDP
jgi:hypothetical protein